MNSTNAVVESSAGEEQAWRKVSSKVAAFLQRTKSDRLKTGRDSLGTSNDSDLESVQTQESLQKQTRVVARQPKSHHTTEKKGPVQNLVLNSLVVGITRCADCKSLQKDNYQHSRKISTFRTAALFGCQSCQLLLHVIEDFAPGWLRPANLVQTLLERKNKDEPQEEKSVSLDVDSNIVRGILQGGPGDTVAERRFDLFMLADEWAGIGSYGCDESIDCTTAQDVPMSLAATWLQNCIENHPSCKVPDPTFMPNRLIAVGLEYSQPFLIDSKIECAPYVALSYCWGDVESTLTTTRENIADHRRCIPLGSLPQTLRDAVIVCRRMKIKYLWIDALCIVQNDECEQDWYAESGKMRHIYSNALFAIAADVAMDCDSGFLRKQVYSPKWRPLSRPGSKDNHDLIGFLRKAPDLYTDPDALTASALSKRGWAMQESILPNRILHFTKEEMVWECNRHCQCECGRPNYSLVKLVSRGIMDHVELIRDDCTPGERTHITDFLSSKTSDSVFWRWQTTVEYYTQRDLTNHEDKLSALSGLAQLVTDSLTVDAGAYLAGLWEGGLVKGLLWYVRGPIEPQRYKKYLAPSWSWASVRGAIKYFTEHYQFVFEENVNILEVHCDTSPLDPTGRVKAGHITLTGKLVAVSLSVDKTRGSMATKYTGYNGEACHTHKNQLVYIQDHQHDTKYEVLLDERMELGTPDGSYYGLQMGTTYDRHTYYSRYWWLVLKKTAPRTQSQIPTFERVGIGYQQTLNSCSLFQGIQEETVQLV